MTDALIAALAANALLVMALTVLYLWATPRVIKATLNNGGGAIIRAQVQAANAEQTIAHQADTRAIVGEHEAREFREYGTLGETVTQVRLKLAAIEAVLTAHIARAP